LAEKRAGNGAPSVQEVAFDYIKSQYFRVIHADGVIGGGTPQGHVHFALFSERPPLAKRQVHSISSQGVLGAPIVEKTVIRDAIIRELDIDVIMTVAVAEQFHQWLGQRLEEIRKMTSGGVTK
jgi:hypothetical protein